VLVADQQRISASTLLDVLADGTAPERSGFRGLAAGIGDAIRRGDVPDGSRLPTERALAAATGTSRGTVVAAYDLLREDGLVLRRQGSGTWVRAGTPSDPRPTAELAAAVRARRLSGRLLHHRDPDLIDLGLSALHEPWGMDPAWFRVSTELLDAAGGRHGYLPTGMAELRRHLAGLGVARGMPPGEEHVAVTHGGQHSISLAARLLIHPGDVVAVESPTFPGAIDAFARAGATFTTFATDSGGPVPEDLARVLDSGAVRAVYLMPWCHSATGSVTGSARRRRIAELLDACDTWLIEDETLAPLRFAGPPGRPISAEMRSDRQVVIGSLSKQIWAGLHVGWMHAPAAFVERVARLRASDDLGGPVLAQLAALAALDGLDERTAALRSEMASRADHLQAAMVAALPDWSLQPPDGGLSIWCTLPVPLADELAAAAPQFGVGVLPGTTAAPDGTGADHVRLSFAAAPDVLDAAVARLAEAWSAVAEHGASR
jgi:DNA-binding transcriptional MocR family regulator